MSVLCSYPPWFDLKSDLELVWILECSKSKATPTVGSLRTGLIQTIFPEIIFPVCEINTFVSFFFFAQCYNITQYTAVFKLQLHMFS